MSHITTLWHTVTDHLNSELGPTSHGGSGQAKTVAPYPAGMSGDEVMHESFNAPAIFVQLVDWRENEDEQGCYVDADFRFMCITKHYKSRNARTFEAAALGESVWCTLEKFHPGDVIEGARLESLNESLNGFSRALDNKNQALWILSATYTLPLSCDSDAPVVDLTQWDIFDAMPESYSNDDFPDDNTDGFADLPDTPATDDSIIAQHTSSQNSLPEQA